MSRLGDALPFAWHYAAARWRFTHLRGEALWRYQDRHARDVLAYARAHSPFFARYTEGVDLADWRSLPILDKASMMAFFDDYTTVGVSRAEAEGIALRSEETRDFAPTWRGHTIVLSSGTSGHRTLSIVSPQENRAFAGFIVSRAIPGLPRRRKVAFFLRANSNLYEGTRSAIIDFRYFDLSRPTDALVAELRSFSPDVVLAPPKMLAVLADAIDAGALALPRLELLFSVADVLEPQDEERFRATFAVDVVRQIYQAAESPMAVSCPKGRLHLQEDLVHVDVEDLGDGRCTPIITSLHRKAQPFVRYRMNDVVVFDDRPCPCGSSFRVLARVEGRSDDAFLLPRHDGTVSHVFPDVLRRICLATPGVREYRVEQDRPDHITFSLDVDGDFAAVADALRGHAARLLALDQSPSVRIDVRAGLGANELDQTRKLRRVRRTFAHALPSSPRPSTSAAAPPSPSTQRS